MRLGRSLKERCTREDPERKVLSAMLEELKNKWSIIRSIAAQRYVCLRFTKERILKAIDGAINNRLNEI